MNVLVVGAGAVGSLLAWALAAGGASVTIVRRRRPGRDGDQGPAASNLTVIRPDGRPGTARVGVVRHPGDLTVAPDLVVLAVKAFDLPAAVASLPEWPGSVLLTVQNGVGSEEAALAARPSASLVAASLTASVAFEPDGSVRWMRPGGIGLAGVRGETAAIVGRLVHLFGRAGLRARTYPDWASMKWSKLVANLVGNATSALLDRDPGQIYREPRLFAIERAQLREALAVMRRGGRRPVALPGANVPGLALAVSVPAALGRAILARLVGGARGGKAPSLRAHVAAVAGPSEARWLNGAVAREGESLGIATPVNATLARLVDAAATDRSVRDWYRDRPDRLVAALAAASTAGIAAEPRTPGAS